MFLLAHVQADKKGGCSVFWSRYDDLGQAFLGSMIAGDIQHSTTVLCKY